MRKPLQHGGPLCKTVLLLSCFWGKVCDRSSAADALTELSSERRTTMLKKVLFATMFLGVLSASGLSLRQLKTGTQHILACGSSCVRTDFCQKPCYCFFSDPQSPTGVCQPEGPAQ
jgi:hypothetical protein